MGAITPEVVDLAGTEVLAQTINPVELFTGNSLDMVLNEIKKQALKVGNDISTAKSRGEIIAMARKVSTTKVQIEKWGLGLTENWRADVKRVNDAKRKASGFLDALRDETRKPVTDWEQIEKLRIAQHESRVETISGYKDLLVESPDADAAKILNWIDNVGKITVDKTWEEFQEEGQDTKDTVMTLLTERLHVRQKYESEQAELAKLREEQAAREKAEYEQRLKDEAAAKAKKEAEEQAEKERLASLQREQAAKDAQAKAERDKIAAQERAKAQAAQAKKDAQEAAERAEREKKEAVEKAELEKQEAVAEAERKAKAEAERLELERKAKEEAARKEVAARAADEKHRKEIETAVHIDLVRFGMGANTAYELISHINNGAIKHVSITY